MSDDWYAQVALSTLRSMVGMLALTATAVKNGDYEIARWSLRTMDADARWVRCALDRNLAAYAP